MVRRVLQMMFKEVRGLHQAAYVLAIFTFGSQILALIRDRLLAMSFGASQELDMYYTAFKIPDLLFVLFASMLSVYVLIPFVAEKRDRESAASARLLLGQVFSSFLVVYSCLALILALALPWLVPYLFPGLSEQTPALVALTRILLLQPFFLGISSLLGVVTQLHHRFVLYAISPLIYNVSIIFGILVFYPMFGLIGLGYGVVLGAVGHMLVQVPFVRTSDLRFGFHRTIDPAQLTSILSVSIPRALALSFNQATLLFLVGFASVMSVGSVSVFQFAYNLNSVPLAIIGVSYSVAAFPILADLHARRDMNTFRAHMYAAIRHIIFWTVPAIALIVVLRAHIVRIVLGAGAFNWDDTRLTAALLALLAFSLVAQACNLLFIRALYAGGYTRVPLLISFGGFLGTLGMAYGLHEWYVHSSWFQIFLETTFRVSHVPGTEVLILAIAYAASSVLQSIWLLVKLAHYFSLDLSWMFERIWKASAAAVVGGVVTYVTLQFVVSGIDQERVMGIVIQGSLAGTAGVLAVVWMYHLLHMPEFVEVRDTLHRRWFKTKVQSSPVEPL